MLRGETVLNEELRKAGLQRDSSISKKDQGNHFEHPIDYTRPRKISAPVLVKRDSMKVLGRKMDLLEKAQKGLATSNSVLN